MGAEAESILFGVVTVQLGLAAPGDVVRASAVREAQLADTLEERGVLGPNERKLVDTVCREALDACGGDVGKALETFGGDLSVATTFGVTVALDTGGLPEVDLAVAEEPMAVTSEQPGRYTFPGHDGQEHSAEPATPGAREVTAPIELGRGGIGRVLLAFDEHLGREVAIKELLLDDRSASTTDTP